MTPRFPRLAARRAARGRMAAVLPLTCVALALGSGSAWAGAANGGLCGAWRSNPLAGMRWGVYTGTIDGVYPAWQTAHGARRNLLGKVALRPLAYWFGDWYADWYAKTAAQQYISQDTGGNPDELAQLAVFRLDPWEGCNLHYSGAAQTSYRHWIDNFAAGIGTSRVALVLQPDMPFALCSSTRVPYELVAYAARKFSSLPHTTVYIDGGVHWFPMQTSQAVWMLEQSGIRYARGFALNTTQYDATGAELQYGAGIVHELQAAGYGTKHMVINTAQNGAPFLAGQYHGNVGNPRVCRNRYDTICATLGIPPTWDTANPRWGLSGTERSIAAQYADAYMWIGRPWLDYGSAPLDLGRALGMAGSTPF